MNHQVASVTAGPSTIHADQPASTPLEPSHRVLAVALQNLNRCSYIFLTDLDSRDQSEQALRKAKEAYRRLTYAQCKNSWISLLLAYQTIGTAEVEHIATMDSEWQHRLFRAHLLNVKHNAHLAEAWQYPEILRHDVNFIPDTYCITANPTNLRDTIRGKSVIVIRIVVHKGKVALWLTLPLHVALVLGIAIGVRSRRADIGIAIGTGIFSLATFLLSLVAWFFA
ncbi:MAG: hypothetical protein M1824_003752 [Vezdaea acicularis]|nr:MAG: hypothetical protein M1824_003752 [Vezdaea acicularis]